MIRFLVGVLVGMALVGFAQDAQASVPLPPTVPEVRFEPCPIMAAPACTRPGDVIYMGAPSRYLGTGHRELARTFWHELGHQFDYQVLHEPHRDKFRELIRTDAPWRAEEDADRLFKSSPHEQFAVAYAVCAMPTRPIAGRIWGEYGYSVRVRTHRRICKLIQNAATTLSGRVPDSPAAHGTPQRAL